VQAGTEVGLSQVLLPMHWGDEFLSGQSNTGERFGGVNAFTSPVFCPDFRATEELKHAAVKVLKADMPWGPDSPGLVARRQGSWRRRAELQALMARFEFASCVLFGNDAALRPKPGAPASCSARRAAPRRMRRCWRRSGPCWTCTGKTPCAMPTPSGASAVRCGPQRSTVQRHAGGLFAQWRDPSPATGWPPCCARSNPPRTATGRALSAGGARPPLPVLSKGRTVCTCFNVSDIAITDTLSRCTGSDPERLGQLQKALAMRHQLWLLHSAAATHGQGHPGS